MDGVQLLERYYAAYNAMDEAGLRDLLADDVEMVPMGAGDAICGAKAYLETYRFILSSFQDVMDPRSIEADGNVVRVDLCNRLTATRDVDDFFGMSVREGETITLMLDARYTLRDGRIARIAIQPAA